MRYYNFALVLLSIIGVAISATCQYKYEDEVINDTIKDIADDLMITECQAGQIYSLIIEANTIFDEVLSSSIEDEASVRQCKNQCLTVLDKFKEFVMKKENQKVIKILGESVNFSNFLDKCRKDCNVLPELIDDKKREEEIKKLEDELKKPGEEVIKPEEKKPEEKKPEEKKPEEKKPEEKKPEEKKPEEVKKPEEKKTLLDRLKSLLDKRDESTCDAVENSRINLIEKNFQYNIPRFQQALDSVETAIVQVNGCGPKLFNKYSIGESYNGLFLPACNSHDVCYDCQMGKSVCDNNFLNNLKKLCDSKYNTKRLVEKILHTDCYSKANIFYTAVSLFGSGSYERCGNIFNSDTNCAFCGNSVVHNVLVNSAFFKKAEDDTK